MCEAYRPTSRRDPDVSGEQIDRLIEASKAPEVRTLLIRNEQEEDEDQSDFSAGRHEGYAGSGGSGQ